MLVSGARPNHQSRSTIWALAPLTSPERHDLLEVLEDRTERASTLITSQVPVEGLARADGRAHAGRRDLRSARPQRLRHRACRAPRCATQRCASAAPATAERGRAGRGPGTAAAQAARLPKTGREGHRRPNTPSRICPRTRDLGWGRYRAIPPAWADEGPAACQKEEMRRQSHASRRSDERSRSAERRDHDPPDYAITIAGIPSAQS